jgi:hypothetical protein
MAIGALVTGACFLAFSVFLIGHVFAARRVTAGRSGWITQRLYPDLVERDEQFGGRIR